MSDNGNFVGETCEEVDTQNSDVHWIENLFPPTFRLSLQELVDGSITASVQNRCQSELPAEPSPTGENDEEVFAKLARRISPLDVDAIKNVYLRVWLMMKANESKESK